MIIDKEYQNQAAIKNWTINRLDHSRSKNWWDLYIN